MNLPDGACTSATRFFLFSQTPPWAHAETSALFFILFDPVGRRIVYIYVYIELPTVHVTWVECEVGLFHPLAS